MRLQATWANEQNVKIETTEHRPPEIKTIMRKN